MQPVPARPLWFQGCWRVRTTCSGCEQRTDWDSARLLRQQNLFEPEIPSVRTNLLHPEFIPLRKCLKYSSSSSSSFSDPPDPPTKLKVNLVTKTTVSLSWEPPKNNGGSPVKHYIIERLSWDTSGKEKETWKQCNKRDVEELTFEVEDLKEVGPTLFISSYLEQLTPVAYRVKLFSEIHFRCFYDHLIIW